MAKGDQEKENNMLNRTFNKKQKPDAPSEIFFRF